MKKKLIRLLAVTFGVVIVGFVLWAVVASAQFTIENEMRKKRNNERTNEEYMDFLRDNQEDFEYVARIMQGMEEISWIYVGKTNPNYEKSGIKTVRIDDHYYTNNQKIADKAAEDQEFYEHLINLKNLDLISRIVTCSDGEGEVMFYFYQFPEDYHGGVRYVEQAEDDYPYHKIDEHWELMMMPNI